MTIVVRTLKGSRRGRRVTLAHRAYFGEVFADAATPAAAKAAVTELAEASLTGEDMPVFVRFGMRFCNVYRTRSGWHYTAPRTLDETPEATYGAGHMLYGNGPHPDRATCLRHATVHLAQNAYDATLDALPLPGLADVPNMVTRHTTRLLTLVHQDDRADLASWLGFQRAWTAYCKSHNLNGPERFQNDEPHAWATTNGASYAPPVPPLYGE